jgi:hypothetical protein
MYTTKNYLLLLSYLKLREFTLKGLNTLFKSLLIIKTYSIRLRLKSLTDNKFNGQKHLPYSILESITLKEPRTAELTLLAED